MSAPAPTTLIEVRSLTKTYGVGDGAFQALRGIVLTIKQGEFVAIIGPSGSGKSTLMNVLGCLDIPTTGTYHYQGIAVGTLDDDQRSLLRRYALAALTSVGLPAKLRSTPGELSGGEQQRVAIARAIVTETSTLFADEPTGNLDSVTTRDVMALLTRLNVDRGITVLVVTHNDEVAACAKRTVLIKDVLIESDVSRA